MDQIIELGHHLHAELFQLFFGNRLGWARKCDIVVEVVDCKKQWCLGSRTQYRCGLPQTTPNVLALGSSSSKPNGQIDSETRLWTQPHETR